MFDDDFKVLTGKDQKEEGYGKLVIWGIGPYGPWRCQHECHRDNFYKIIETLYANNGITYDGYEFQPDEDSDPDTSS